ncbi:hypothetical protein O0L34_g17080 [Tuta absoluta]|nr:hypothetical protein O0L34_g17080 [Tuta absoluta]
MTPRGNPVIVMGPYRYNRWSGSRGPQVRWTCVKTQVGCRATLTTLDDEIVKMKNQHSHPAAGEHRPIFTTSRFGKPVIQVGPYRFNKWTGSKGPRARWVCGRVAQGCKATIRTINNEIHFIHEHNH